MKLSIVIAELGGEASASLRSLANVDDVEIISMRAKPGSSIYALRTEGIAKAKGERIAVLGANYRVTPKWLETVVSADPFDVTGGCIAPSPDLGYWGWCVYLSEYAHVAPPISPGAVTDLKHISGGNVVYRRSALDNVRLTDCGTELEMHRRLLGSGASFGLIDAMEACYARSPEWGEYLRERFHFSRAIAAERGIDWRIALMPGLPFLILARTAMAVFRKRRYRLRFLACAPVIFLLGFVQALGELSVLRGG